MAATRPLHRPSTVDALADALKREILDGGLPAGSRLRERELCEAYGVARHSLRAALRALATEGLVRIEPHRGARVAELSADDVRWLYELRTALELEAAHLALERNGGRLPPEVHEALARLERGLRGRSPWSAINEAHADLHAAIVAAAHSPRIAAAHAALSGEMRLFLLALRPHIPPDRARRRPRRARARARARRPVRAARAPALRGRDAGGRLSPLDPRLERFKPALVYDPQEAYRAMSAASITDNRDNALKRKNGNDVARAGSGLTLGLLASYEVQDGDRIDQAGDYLTASRRFQGDPGYRERVYGRVKEDGGRTWLQYWLWCYYNPKHLLGWGKHEGDWEVVQIGLDGDDPDVLTYSQHENGEAKDWDDARRQGEHPIVYVAPLSHACYFEPGAHPYVLGVDNPDDSLAPVLPKVEEFGAWSTAGTAAGERRAASSAASSAVAARPAPAARARSGTTRPPGTAARGRPSRCGRAAPRSGRWARRPTPS